MIITQLILHCVSNNKHGSPGASSRPGEALPHGTGSRWGRGEPCCRESMGLPTQGHAGMHLGFPSVGQKNTVPPRPSLQPLQVPATWKISSDFIQAPFPQSPCIRPGQSLHYFFSASFPLAAAQGNLLAKSCRGGFGAFSWHSPGLFLLWLSRIVKEATPAALGSHPAPVRHRLCLPGEMHIHAGGWRGAWAWLRGCSQGTGARDHLPSPALPWGTCPAALFALGWVQAVDTTPLIPG